MNKFRSALEELMTDHYNGEWTHSEILDQLENLHEQYSAPAEPTDEIITAMEKCIDSNGSCADLYRTVIVAVKESGDGST